MVYRELGIATSAKDTYRIQAGMRPAECESLCCKTREQPPARVGDLGYEQRQVQSTLLQRVLPRTLGRRHTRALRRLVPNTLCPLSRAFTAPAVLRVRPSNSWVLDVWQLHSIPMRGDTDAAGFWVSRTAAVASVVRQSHQ